MKAKAKQSITTETTTIRIPEMSATFFAIGKLSPEEIERFKLRKMNKYFHGEKTGRRW
jgi:uncharacterized protein involved in tellurium resistance